MMPLRFALILAGSLALATTAAPAREDSGAPSVPAGFRLQVIAHIEGPREMLVTPHGELMVATLGNAVYAIDDAEGTAQMPRVFARIDDAPVAGVALGPDALFFGSKHGVWRVPFHGGDRSATAAPKKIADVRTGGQNGHVTTSLAFANGRLYASVGSSCNMCEETDPTRATILSMAPDGTGAAAKATHIRNAVALAVDAASGAVWAGVAGQDELKHGHPYEIFDPFTLHAGTPQYGWPTCYENHRVARPGANCAGMTVARVVFPAYETPIGAAIYPRSPSGDDAFPERYRGGAFVALHGSWHQPPVPPRVVFVPLRGDEPLKSVDWSDPSIQWSSFLDGFQRGDSRIGRPTGVAVGPHGSLFVGDDLSGVIYRITPTR